MTLTTTTPGFERMFAAERTPAVDHLSGDHELLRRYVERGCEAAFAQLVARYAPLVYAAALRQVGRAELAEDVAQAAFILLAQKARRLDAHVVLGAWLHRVTRYAALNARRGEARRRRHERKAIEMAAVDERRRIDAASPARAAATSVAWGEGMRLLDAGIAGLPDRDRDAIVLRYLQRNSLAEVGAALGVSEEAAQMRVSRAVEKLRAFYRRRGLTLTTAQMGAAVGVNAHIAMPEHLAGSLASTALRSTAGGSTAAAMAASAAKSMVLAKARMLATLAAGAAVIVVVCLQVGSAILDARKAERPARQDIRVASAEPLDASRVR